MAARRCCTSVCRPASCSATYVRIAPISALRPSPRWRLWLPHRTRSLLALARPPLASACGCGDPSCSATPRWWRASTSATPGYGSSDSGSRLWLLSREKQTAATLNRAREYAEEALAWLTADGIARSVTVSAAWVRTGLLGMTIDVLLKDGTLATHHFDQALER